MAAKLGAKSDVPSTAAGTLFSTEATAMHNTMRNPRRLVGFFPARDSTRRAKRRDSPNFVSTADIEKPQRNIKMTGLKKAPLATTAAWAGCMGCPGNGSVELQ